MVEFPVSLLHLRAHCRKTAKPSEGRQATSKTSSEVTFEATTSHEMDRLDGGNFPGLCRTEAESMM